MAWDVRWPNVRGGFAVMAGVICDVILVRHFTLRVPHDTQEYNCLGNLLKCWGVTCDEFSRGVTIILATSIRSHSPETEDKCPEL